MPSVSQSQRALGPHHPPPSISIRRLPRWCLLICLLPLSAVLLANTPQGGSYTLRKQVIAAGGTTSSGGAYRLIGTVGQSVVDRISGGTQQIQQGFHTTGGERPDGLFNDGFE